MKLHVRGVTAELLRELRHHGGRIKFVFIARDV
jgi:hypothetical protein